MRRFGLIGFPLTHSFSAEYFTAKFKREGVDAVYNNYPIENIDLFPLLLDEKGPFDGLNVTIPFKESVTRFMDTLDAVAEGIGAVNLVQVSGRGTQQTLTGFNTDVEGFTGALNLYGIKSPRRSLVLGTGGASKAVIYGLRMIGSEVTTVSREKKRGDLTYPILKSAGISGFDLIVNTTPLGMYPLAGNAPDIPYDELGPRNVLFDLVYNPAETLFLRRGKERGCRVFNGLDMLHIQAEEGWRIWQSRD